MPDGFRKEQIEPIRQQIKIEAKEAVRIMSETYNIEDEYAKTALETAVEVMKTPGENRERVAAARLVLDFTKSKPSAKSEVSISKAEDFLASLIDEDDG